MAKLTAAARRRIPKSEFAGPHESYPVNDKPHARNAKARASQAVNAGRMSRSEEHRIDAKADRVLGKSHSTHEGKTLKHEHECKGKHCKHPSHGKSHERHEKHAEHKGKHHHEHGKHHDPEMRGKHKTGRGMTGEGSPRYEREMDGQSKHSTPIKVPPSMPWPHDEYKGRGHHTISERSNGMLLRHDAGRKIKVTR